MQTKYECWVEGQEEKTETLVFDEADLGECEQERMYLIATTYFIKHV